MAEEILDVLVPEMVEQLVKLPKTVSEDRIPQRTAERIVNIPVPQDVEELVEVSRVFPQDRIQQRFGEQTDETPDISLVNTRVQHVVPLLQFTDKVVDIPVVAQRQSSQLQKTDGVVAVPAVLVVLVPQVQVVEKTAEIPQLLADMQVPQGQVVPETVEIPKLPFFEKIAVIPEIRTAPGTQTSQSLNGEFDAGHDEKSEQDALAVGVVCEAE